MEWTVKSVLSTVFFLGIGLYVVYQVWPSPQYHVHPHHLMTWKHKDFVDIPKLILKNSETIKPELKRSKFELGIDQVRELIKFKFSTCSNFFFY